jgi:nitroimidazol reductase NimA-like FMN-containing flavoprotein (pyridoxamine 5'-phosphate oxidase superfamily)
MSEAPGALSLAEVRRKDRAVPDEGWIRDLLKRAAVGTPAPVRDGQPLLNMNIFVYDEEANVLSMHTARSGRTRSNVEAEDGQHSR